MQVMEMAWNLASTPARTLFLENLESQEMDEGELEEFFTDGYYDMAEAVAGLFHQPGDAYEDIERFTQEVAGFLEDQEAV